MKNEEIYNQDIGAQVTLEYKCPVTGIDTSYTTSEFIFMFKYNDELLLQVNEMEDEYICSMVELLISHAGSVISEDYRQHLLGSVAYALKDIMDDGENEADW